MLNERILCNMALLKHLLRKNGHTVQIWNLRPRNKTNILPKTYAIVKFSVII